MFELIPLIDESLHNVIGESKSFDCKEGRSSCCQREVKTLVLIEDVDITFVEDHGFIAAIKQIAETAKRPIILTSSCKRLSDFYGLLLLAILCFDIFSLLVIIIVVNPRSQSSPARQLR